MSEKDYIKREKERKHLDALKEMPKFLIHEIDWGNLSSPACYNYAVQLAMNNELAGISRNSFFSRIKKYIDKQIKKDEYFKIDESFCRSMTEA